MTPETEVYLGILSAFLMAGVIFIIMMRLQKKKEEAADRQFQLTMDTMKARGAGAARQQMEKKKK